MKTKAAHTPVHTQLVGAIYAPEAPKPLTAFETATRIVDAGIIDDCIEDATADLRRKLTEARVERDELRAVIATGLEYLTEHADETHEVGSWWMGRIRAAFKVIDGPRALSDLQADALTAAAERYPTATRDMVSRASVRKWLLREAAKRRHPAGGER